MQSGDTLSLATNGNYTLGAGTDGFTTLPSGRPGSPTVLLGNGATITGGRDGLSLYGKSDISISNLNFVNQTRYCITYDRCYDISQSGCTYKSTLGTDFLDVLKIYRSDDLTFTNCTVLATTGANTCDGFEFWGPCNHVAVTNCIVDQIAGGVSPDHHAFEVYGESAAEICNDIVFTNCHAESVDVGFSSEGGPSSNAIHTNVKAITCTTTGMDNYDAQGIQGATLYVTAGTLTSRNGSVTEL